MCGGTERNPPAAVHAPGLSPRVRGNPAVPPPCGIRARSIPACAGEPAPPLVQLGDAEVYPRVCGGTCGRREFQRPRLGLSPRVRGNPYIPYIAGAVAGSIPACAGEPAAICSSSCADRVYPRVCGGTRLARLPSCVGMGLSPRVRGNRDTQSDAPVGVGSIPACAGEPCADCATPLLLMVYPRVCGGTPA